LAKEDQTLIKTIFGNYEKNGKKSAFGDNFVSAVGSLGLPDS